MATSVWSAWDDDLLSEMPGALATLVRHHVKLAAIEFCNRAWVWVVDQGPISVAAGANEYAWEPPASTEVARILVAWLDKKKLTAQTRKELSALYGDYMRAQGPATYFIQDVPSKLILVPTPTSSSADGITAKIAVKPARAATGLDSEIFNRYFDQITRGAKARLFGMAKKPWSDPAQARDLREAFEQDIAEAKLELTRSFAGARLRATAQFF
jgi:hypothetical protein